MTLQTILYFSSILLTCILTGFLAWYAWKHQQVPAARAYMHLTLSECFFALMEIFSVLSPSSATALFWFQARYIAGAFMAVFWFVFALEYSGHREWLSKRLLAGLFVIPFVTQVLLWSNPLHGLWIKQEAGFTQNGIFWIADITSRIPGLGYLTHSFYTLLLTLAGIALMFLTAWKMRRELLGQAVMLAGAGLTAFIFAMNSLFNFLPKTGFNPFTPGIGLSVLLIALSVFRFEFLKRAPAQEDVLHVNRLDAQEKYSLAVFILIFILFTSGLAATSTLTYQNYERQFSIQVENQLSAIAALKVDELQNWRDERLADASLFYRNKNFSRLVQRYLENPQDTAIQAELLDWFGKIQSHPEYTRVFLLTPQGVELLSLPETSKAIPEDLIQQVSACLASGEISFLDFHRHADKDIVHLSLLIPIFDAQDDKRPLGVLILLIDPNVYLYPFIQQWPVPSQSAETLLVRREGEAVLYLNELRFEQATALTRRFPLSNTDLPAVRAVLGETGIVEGVDYRGSVVIADLRPVPGSPWFLVSKMDTAEVYAPLRERLWQTILFFGALILMSGAGLMLVWRQQRVHFYKAQYETAESLRKSQEQYRGLIEHASDGIFIADGDGRYLEANPGGCAMLGYTRDEILAKHISDLVAPEDIAATPLRLEELRQGKTVISERRLIRKDGSLLPVEISGRMLPDGRFQSITRDITERKQVQEALRSSEEKFRLAFDTSPDSVAITRLADGMFVSVNKGFEQISGYTREQAIGKTSAEINIWKDPEDRRKVVEALRAKGEVQNYEAPFLTCSGEIYGLMSAAIIELNGEPHILNIVRDITERKQAEEKLIDSETRYRRLFEAARDGILILDADTGIVVDVNPFLIEMLGFPQEEFVGKELWELGLFKDVAANKDNFLELQQKEYIRYEDLPLETADGRRIDVEFVSNVYQVDHHKVVQCNIRDITERKQAEDALLRRENLLNKIFDVLPVGIWLADKNGQLTRSNQRGREIWGAEPLVGQEKYGVFKARRLTSGEELTPEDWALAHTIKEGVTVLDEMLEIDSFDGKKKIILNFTAPVFDATGNVEAAVIINLDITERKQAEEKIKENASLLRIAGEKTKLGGWSVDLRNNLCTWSDQTAAIHETPAGYSPLVEEGISYYAPEWREKITKVFTECVQNGIPYDEEMEIITANGKRVWVWTIGESVKDEAGKIIKVQGAFQDITERKQAENALRESEEEYRSLVHSIQVGVVVHAPDSSVLFSNPMASQLLGLTPDQMRNKSAIDEVWRFIREDETRMPLEEYPVNQALAANKPITNLILGILRPDREGPTWVQCNAHQDWDFNGNLQQVVVSFADITERKQAEQIMQGYNAQLETEVEQRTRELRGMHEQLVRQERLAALGQLAGSIGHELRNPLGVISNAVYFLKLTQTDASEKVREYLDIIDNETRTSDKIVTDLLDFTRIKSLDRQPVSVSELIRQSLERHPAPESVETNLEIPADLPQIYVDPQHVIQVLGNLVSNACQSMTDRGTNGRKLTVSAAAQSAMIKIEVQDTGTGIPPENMKKIFEPLFTTKVKGIGLGLAVSRKLTEANGGRIEVQSEPGKGSIFTVYLPTYQQENR